MCRKRDGKGNKEVSKEVNKAWNKYAKYTTVGDGKALWKAAAEELAAYAAQVRPCYYNHVSSGLWVGRVKDRSLTHLCSLAGWLKM